MDIRVKPVWHMIDNPIWQQQHMAARIICHSYILFQIFWSSKSKILFKILFRIFWFFKSKISGLSKVNFWAEGPFELHFVEVGKSLFKFHLVVFSCAVNLYWGVVTQFGLYLKTIWIVFGYNNLEKVLIVFGWYLDRIQWIQQFGHNFATILTQFGENLDCI